MTDRCRPRAYYASWSDNQPNATADEVIVDDEDRATGVLDARGDPIKRPSPKIPLGFHIVSQRS